MTIREYEVIINNKQVSMDELKKKIKLLGGKIRQKNKLYKYIIYEHPLKKKDYFIRIRDESGKITLTIKTKLKEKFPLENEIVINNFKEADNILTLLGCKKVYELQKYREVWNFKNCKEIVFDTYPGIETYAEIECKTKKNLITTLQKLDLITKLNYYKKFIIVNYYKNFYGIRNNLVKYDKVNLLKFCKKNKDILKKNLIDYSNLL